MVDFKEKQPTQLMMPNSGGETGPGFIIGLFDTFRRRGKSKVISKSPPVKTPNSGFLKSHPNSGGLHQVMSHEKPLATISSMDFGEK